jgi:xylulokinase
MALLLGIDLGTSYFKVGLFSPDGELRGLGRAPAGTEQPAPDRAELPVAVFWERLRRALDQALEHAGADAGEIAGLSYSSQANTFVLLDAGGTELTPLIVWNDRRAHPVDADLAAFGDSPEHGPATGMCGMVPERAPVKGRWLARHEPEVWSRARRFLTISDYLTYRLTGEAAGDASTAVLTGLYHLATRGWWPEALAAFGLQAGMLATPRPPGTPCGRTTEAARTLLGLTPGIPFAVGALDHHAAALGSGLGETADASLSTGTVLAAMVLVSEVDPTPGCIHGPHTDGIRFYRLAFDPDGAGRLEAYQQRHAPDLTIKELLRQAGQRTPGHGREVRALLENIASTHHELLRRVAGATAVKRLTATGGGARSPLWLQITADTIGLPVAAVDSPERACLGAAMFAAAACGMWPDIETAARRMLPPPRVFVPGEKTAAS